MHFTAIICKIIKIKAVADYFWLGTVVLILSCQPSMRLHILFNQKSFSVA